MNLIKFNLDSTTGIPVYRQIIQQVEHKISIGDVKAGDKLPTVRNLAVELKINPNTVAKAYSELEIRGLVNTQVGYGTFISDKEVEISQIELNEKIEDLCVNFIKKIKNLGISNNDIINSIKKYLED